VSAPKDAESPAVGHRYLGLSVATWTVIGAIATVASLVVGLFIAIHSTVATPASGTSPKGVPHPKASANPTNSEGPTVEAWTPVPTSAWHVFGHVSVTFEPAGIMRISFGQPLTLDNKWAGAIAQVPASCNYAIEMQARVVNLSSPKSGFGGYGIASGALEGVLPQGAAFQYDFGFGGYRVLTYPDDFAQPSGSYSQAILNRNWHTIRVIVSRGIAAYVDGAYALAMASPDACGRPIIRVWSATVEFRNIMIQRDNS
jgi:hypothetical protein